MKKKILAIILLIFVVTGCIYDDKKYENNNVDKLGTIENPYLEVHFLDVDQADSIFIEINNDKTMLIDAGTKSSSDKIIKYIDNLGYNKIDYLIATHPHADHIGSMSEIVESYEIGQIYMPKVTTNTKTFENLLEAIDNKKMSIISASADMNIINENDMKVEIISPIEDKYDDLNNYSVCIKITYKNVSYLFMGDAEKEVEEQITADVKADVIKVGHHGSNTSSSFEFVKRVSPSYAVISVGKDNSYGHPHDEVIQRYEEIGAKIYRTDINGDIIIATDGDKIDIKTQK